jgi:hypothetical protein
MLGLSCVRASSRRLPLLAARTGISTSRQQLNNTIDYWKASTSTCSRRPLSSSYTTRSTATATTLVEDDAEQPEIVLYQRGPGRNALPRSGLGFSSFHTAYWIWYSADFIPTVNASEMHNLHIDPMLGVVGICFASIIQVIFFTYPKKLVSRLTFKPDSKQLLFYTHSIPFVTPATTASIYTLGDAPVLDASSADAKHLMEDLSGDISQYRGIMAVSKKGQWPPFLLDIREPSDVAEPELMLEALLTPDRMGGKGSADSRKKWANPNSRRRAESQLRTIVRRRR